MRPCRYSGSLNGGPECPSGPRWTRCPVPSTTWTENPIFLAQVTHALGHLERLENLLPPSGRGSEGEVDGRAEVVPVAQIESDVLLIINIAELGILHRTVLPYQILPVDHLETLLNLL